MDLNVVDVAETLQAGRTVEGRSYVECCVVRESEERRSYSKQNLWLKGLDFAESCVHSLHVRLLQQHLIPSTMQRHTRILHLF